MSALWTVCILLVILGVANAVGVIALTRQVGLLHLRTASPQGSPPPRGLQPGDRLRLDPVRFLDVDSAPDLVLLGFVRPNCHHCAAALPAFAALASGLPDTEKVLLVSDANQATTRSYLAAHGVSLPLAAGPHLLSANGIPAIPYAVVADAAGTVIAAQNAGSTEQLEHIMGQARRSSQPGSRPDSRPGRPSSGKSSQEERYVV